MSVLFDISHPAHVHFFLPLAEALMADGVAIHVVARDKDITVRLLNASGLPFEVLPMNPPGTGQVQAAKELLRRSLALRRRILQHNIRVVLTRNPSGAIAAFGTQAISIFDTDDGRSAGIHYWAARPFSNFITSSSFDPESHGRGHMRYRALKAQMFTDGRPSHSAQIEAISELPANPLFVVRFSSHTASHDSRVHGIDHSTRKRLLSLLSAQGDLVISTEGSPPYLIPRGADSGRRCELESVAFLNFLARADLVVSDSGSVCAEAALLGAPSIVFGSFVSSRFYIQELASRGLLRAFPQGHEDAFLAEVSRAAGIPTMLRESHQRKLREFKEVTEPLLEWYLRVVQAALRNSQELQ